MRSPRDTRGQLGQTTTEWLGVMAVVATLALLVAGASKPVANQITCKATGFVGQLIGQEWGCREDKLAALPPCIVSQGDGQLKASVTVFSVKGGGKVKVVKQRRSDGKWIMTVIGGGELGGEFGTPGGGISVDTGTSETGAGEGADGSVVVNGEYGASWVFDDEKGANDFVDIVRNKLRDKAIDASVPIVGSIGTHFFGEKRDIPSPDIEYVQGGVAGSADAEAEGGAAGLKGTFDASAAIGVRWNHRADTKTIYFNADAKAKGTAKLLAGIGLEGQVEGQIAVTYDDKTGKAVAVDVIGKGSASGVGPGVPLSGNPKEFLSKIKWTGSAGGRVEAQLHLDLTNPANAQAWDDFRANPFTGAGDLTNAFLDHGQAQVRTYETGKDKYGLDANVKAGLEFGIDASYEGTRADLIKAWDWNPNSGWSDSATCKT